MPRNISEAFDEHVAARLDQPHRPAYEGTMRLLEGHSDEELLAMTEFLEQGRELVERELGGLEREQAS